MGIERQSDDAVMTEAAKAGTPDMRHVRALFDEAAAAQGGARQALLDGADPAVRDAVADLLEAGELFHPVLDRPLVVPAPLEGLFEEGDCTGRYRIVREIGAGGMGTVYLAELADRESSPRFALKVVRFPSRELARRLAEESKILSRLEHPNVARLLDIGMTSSGLPFFVMEYVDGRPIDEYRSAKRLGPADCARLFRQVCAAVSYLHRNLVVHRDLKPANILVTSDGLVKVVDFGIARLLEQTGGQTLGATLGPLTPEYASPEQVRGEAISTQTDVFTLGAVLYELLTGVKPFRGNPIEVLQRVCSAEPVRPGAYNRGVTQDLDSIVGQAMRKEPERRYASADQLDEDLRRYLAGLPILARGDAIWYRAGKFAARHKTMLGATAVVALALAGGVAATDREARIAHGERLRAEKEARVANEQRQRAEQGEAEANRQRSEAERRLKDLAKLARGAVRAYGAAIEPGKQEAQELLAENARDSMAALGREGMLDAADQRVLDAASAELRSHDLAAPASWQVPKGWLSAGSPQDYRIGIDRQFLYRGKPSLFLRSLTREPKGSAAVSQEFRAQRYRGRRVRLSAMLRTERVERGVLLSLRESSGGGDGAQATGSQAWKPYTLVIDIPDDADIIEFRLSLSGTGTVWASNFDFREVSRSVPLTKPLAPRNLNFTGRQ